MEGFYFLLSALLGCGLAQHTPWGSDLAACKEYGCQHCGGRLHYGGVLLIKCRECRPPGQITVASSYEVLARVTEQIPNGKTPRDLFIKPEAKWELDSGANGVDLSSCKSTDVKGDHKGDHVTVYMSAFFASKNASRGLFTPFLLGLTAESPRQLSAYTFAKRNGSGKFKLKKHEGIIAIASKTMSLTDSHKIVPKDIFSVKISCSKPVPGLSYCDIAHTEARGVIYCEKADLVAEGLQNLLAEKLVPQYHPPLPMQPMYAPPYAAPTYQPQPMPMQNLPGPYPAAVHAHSLQPAAAAAPQAESVVMPAVTVISTPGIDSYNDHFVELTAVPGSRAQSLANPNAATSIGPSPPQMANPMANPIGAASMAPYAPQLYQSPPQPYQSPPQPYQSQYPPQPYQSQYPPQPYMQSMGAQ